MKNIRRIVLGVSTVVLLGILTYATVSAATLTASSDPIKLLQSMMGRYEFNFTGNTNHFDWWDDDATILLNTRNFKDRVDIVSSNNSTGTLVKGASDARVAKAFLIWETRAQRGMTAPIQLYTPNSGTQYYNIAAEYACVDTRTAPNGTWTYHTMYCMATDVTSIVQQAGYGDYTVANIPVWNNEDNSGTGGESVASWQLIIIEESETYSVKNVTLDIASKFYMAQDFAFSLRSIVASKESGVVNGQIFYGTSNSSYATMTENYEAYDTNGNMVGSGVVNQTSQAGLYKNGAAFNTRDQLTHDGSPNGTIRMSLSDISDVGNDVTRLRMAIENDGWTTTFVMGVSYDINMYTVSYDGNGAQSGWTERTSCLFNREYTINENGFVYKYHKFLGWNTEKDGSGQWWYPGDTYSNLCSTSGDDYKLYAQWETLGAMITLDNQGADIEEGTPKYFEKYNDRNYTDDDCVTPIDQIVIPEKTGDVFDGYYTEKNGNGIMYVDPDGTILSTSTTFKDDTTLYAKWAPDVYKITLDNQGANEAGTLCYYEKYTVGNFADEACTIPITDITMPVKKGFVFKGYWSEIGGYDGGGTVCVTEQGKICTTSTQFTEDTTIYADWESGYFVITCDNQGATTPGSEKFYEQYAVQFLYDKVVLLDGTTDLNYATAGTHIFVAPYTGSYSLKVYGAQGGSASFNGASSRGGYGGYSYGDIELSQGDIVYIYVGGMGGTSQATVAGAGGFNGGGYGARDWGADFVYGGGGGATDIRVVGTALANRVIVAGGGGGGAIYGSVPATGGAGGGLTYQPVYAVVYGSSSAIVNTRPATQTAMLGTGRNGSGGGYYGGKFYGDSVYVAGGEGGTGYVGGVTGGASVPNLHSGNGVAIVTRSNYTTEVTPTTKIEVPTKTGYYFRGYYTETNGAGTMVTDAWGNIVVDPDFFTADTTVYAYWSNTAETRYIIRFHGNGETSGSMADMSCIYGKTYTLTPLAYEKTGYHFLKWTTNEDGTGTEYTDEQSISNLSAVDGDIIHLYAQWEGNSYTLTFHPNDGSEVVRIEDMTVRYGEKITLPDVKISEDEDAYVKYTLDGVNITDEVLSRAIVLAMDGTLKNPVEDSEKESAEETMTASVNKKDVGVVAAPEDGTQEQVEDEEPTADKKAYHSVFMGWALEEDKDTFVPQWEIEEIDVSAIIDAAGYTDQEGATITLYAVWDDCPWITATHLYYTLEQAQSGFITQDEILSHATALDREDGSPIEPGVHDNGTSFSIPDYAPTDFTQFQHEGSCTENLTVVDSTGSVYAKQITVYVVDTTPKPVEPEATSRFINEYYYNQPYENGGLEEDSVWLTDPEYVAVIQDTFENIRNDTPEATYYFTREEILEMKAYIDEHGIYNTGEEGALEGFYEQFVAPNKQE